MPIRLIRKSWFVDFYFGHERCRKRSPLNTPEGALAYEMFLRKEVGYYGSIRAALRAHDAPKGIPSPTLAEFTERWFARYVVVKNRPMEQRKKRRTFSQHLLPFFGSMRLSDISLEEIEAYKGLKITDGYAPKSINNHLTILHRCLVSAKEWNVIRTPVPAIPIVRSTQPKFRFLSEDESQRLLAVSPSELIRTMMLVGLRTGLRFCELSGLRWSDVDLPRKLLTVSTSLVGGHMSVPKNGRIRHIPLTEQVVVALGALSRNGDHVFQRNGHPIAYSYAWKVINRASIRAGIEHTGWHGLRHTFASQLVERGAILPSVQQLLGHSDVQITMRYSHLGKTALHDAIALLEL